MLQQGMPRQPNKRKQCQIKQKTLLQTQNREHKQEGNNIFR